MKKTVKSYRDSAIRAKRASKFYKDTARYYKDAAQFYRDYSSLKEAAAVASKMAKKAVPVATEPNSVIKLKEISSAADSVAAGSGKLSSLIGKIKEGFSAIPKAFKSFFEKIVEVLSKLRAKLRGNPAVQESSSADMKKILAQLEGKSSSSEVKSWLKKLMSKPPKSMKELSVEITGAGPAASKDELRALLSQMTSKKAKNPDLPFAYI